MKKTYQSKVGSDFGCNVLHLNFMTADGNVAAYEVQPVSEIKGSATAGQFSAPSNSENASKGVDEMPPATADVLHAPDKLRPTASTEGASGHACTRFCVFQQSLLHDMGHP